MGKPARVSQARQTLRRSQDAVAAVRCMLTTHSFSQYGVTQIGNEPC